MKKKTLVLGGCLLLSSLAQAQPPPAPPQPNPQAVTFFVTSESPGKGADFGGLAGADAHCDKLAKAAGSTGKTWRACLRPGADRLALPLGGNYNGIGPSLGAITSHPCGPPGRKEDTHDRQRRRKTHCQYQQPLQHGAAGLGFRRRGAGVAELGGGESVCQA
ncbi:MAG: hypothetical protein ACM31P_15120 [Actinomycetota bacterium]